jgi:hypothetical protein
MNGNTLIARFAPATTAIIIVLAELLIAQALMFQVTHLNLG